MTKSLRKSSEWKFSWKSNGTCHIGVQHSSTRSIMRKWSDLCRAHIDPAVNKVVPNFDFPASFEKSPGSRHGSLAELGHSRYAFIIQALLRIFIKRPNCCLSFWPTYLINIPPSCTHGGDKVASTHLVRWPTPHSFTRQVIMTSLFTFLLSLCTRTISSMRTLETMSPETSTKSLLMIDCASTWRIASPKELTPEERSIAWILSGEPG